ncbi:hypothetical protein [uncultured Streptomyces sp.]|uniref:hypothetical protein n=1 Tax=uncultured Streptomyces sp. TaxID=174707 RepID=UPI00262731FE|nr:hypothetical protein [uncultured Streptomyces sp.]
MAAGQGRTESRTEYRERVGEDLDLSLRTFADHGLPRPRPFAFAFPFSDGSGVEGRNATGGS